MKDNSISKRSDAKPAANPSLCLGAPSSTSSLNPAPRQDLRTQQPIGAPTWARYIDSRMKHFGTR